MPKVTTAEPELHVEMVIRSETQYVTKAPLPHVLLSGGTGSMSALVQTSGGAMLLGCFANFQLDGCVSLEWALLAAALPRSLSLRRPIILTMRMLLVNRTARIVLQPHI
jgi:hypothetical protein